MWKHDFELDGSFFKENIWLKTDLKPYSKKVCAQNRTEAVPFILNKRNSSDYFEPIRFRWKPTNKIWNSTFIF